MRRPWLRPLLTSTALVLVGACASSAPTVRTQASKGVDFGSFETVAFGGAGELPKGYTRGKLPDSFIPVARDVFRSTFTEKGYRIVDDPETADLVLVGGVGSKEKTIQNPSPARDGGTFSVAMPEMKVAHGAIAIDAFSRASGDHVWTGTLEAMLKERPADEEAFRRALTALLAEFPARSAD